MFKWLAVYKCAPISGGDQLCLSDWQCTNVRPFQGAIRTTNCLTVSSFSKSMELTVSQLNTHLFFFKGKWRLITEHYVQPVESSLLFRIIP